MNPREKLGLCINEVKTVRIRYRTGKVQKIVEIMFHQFAKSENPSNI